MTCHQNAFVLGQQVPDEIGDGVALSRTGWPLHQNGSGFIKLADHTFLFRIGYFSQKDLRVFRLLTFLFNRSSRIDSHNTH